jgi:hypothetical protein
MRPCRYGEIGVVLATSQFMVVGLEENVVIDSDIAHLKEAWQRPLRW